jgi:hypothetical protein
MSQYYFSTDGTTQQGPVAKEGLRAAGVGPETMVWREGWPDWMPAGKSPELSDLFTGPSSPPPFAASQTSYQPPMGHHPAGGPPHFPPPNPNSGNNGYAIASLICSICGLIGFCCCGGIVASILGVVFGHIAVGQISRGQGSGMGLAKAGLIIGYIGIVLCLLGLTLSVSNHGFKTSGTNFNWKFGPGK